MLVGLGAIRNGNAAVPQPEASKQFVSESVKHFRTRIMEEEKEEMAAYRDATSDKQQ